MLLGSGEFVTDLDWFRHADLVQSSYTEQEMDEDHTVLSLASSQAVHFLCSF